MTILVLVGPADHFVHVKWNAPLDFKRTLKFLQFPNGEGRLRYGCGIHRVFDCLLNQDHWVVRMKTAEMQTATTKQMKDRFSKGYCSAVTSPCTKKRIFA